ncbi:MAG: DUF3500 domain-containing protein [Myxococcota bacterium]
MQDIVVVSVMMVAQVIVVVAFVYLYAFALPIFHARQRRQKTTLAFALALSIGATSGGSQAGASDVDLYASEVASAAQAFLESLTPAQRDKLVFPFDSIARTHGRDTSQTPSFCAILQWCPAAWGLTQCSLSQRQRVAMHTLLSLALSSGGYQMVNAVMLRNRLIGELEHASDPATSRKARDAKPKDLAQSIFEFQDLAPVGSRTWYPAVGGAKQYEDGTTRINWAWDPPGLKERRTQFCDYSIAIYGEPGSARWAFRFEGHHLSVNLTFLKDRDTGETSVYTTPLFIGAFPMVIPEAPPGDDITEEWTWAQGQQMMYRSAIHLNQFWQSMPRAVRKSAHIGPTVFGEAAELLLDTPTSSLIAVLSPEVDADAIQDYASVDVLGRTIGARASWHLRQALGYYLTAMNPTIAEGYLERIDASLSSSDTITIAWAGGALDDPGNHHYSYLRIGSILFEFLQSNEYAVQHNPAFTGNHVHSALRDLSFDWTDPMRNHHHGNHLHTTPRSD